MAASDAQPLPRRGQAWRFWFNIPKTDGTYLTGAAGLAATLSLDGATAASVTNAPVEAPASSGFYYIDLTAAETDADALLIKPSSSSSGAVTVPYVILTDTGQLDAIEALAEYTAEVSADNQNSLVGVVAEIAAINAVIPVMSGNISDVETATGSLQTDIDALTAALTAAQEDIDTLKTGVNLNDNALTSAKTASSFVSELNNPVLAAIADIEGGEGGGGGSVTLSVGLNASGRLPDGVVRLTAGDTAGFLDYQFTDVEGRALSIPEEAVLVFSLRKVGEDDPDIDEEDAEVKFAAQGWVRFTFTEALPVPDVTGSYIAQFRYSGVSYPIGKQIPVTIAERV